MTVGLFVPCYIDQLYPFVAVATLELLERFGCDVVYPRDQTCCGQPMANAGCVEDAAGAHRVFTEQFSRFDYIVGPSGSCVLHVREHMAGPASKDSLGAVRAAAREVAGKDVGARTYELCQFLVDVLEIDRLDVSFAHRVGLHAACHGLRGLRIARASEIQAEPYDHVADLLGMVDGLELVELARTDECCGFGGTFAVSEEAVSVRMGRDRLADHLRGGAEVITSTDMSCLMHLDGLILREKLPVRVLHVAEILAGHVDARRAAFAGRRASFAGGWS